MLASQTDFQFYPPRVLLGLVLAAAISVLFCYPVSPGLMSFDSLFAYQESITGIVAAVLPPMHAYLFYLSRAAGGGVAGLFYGQAFILFFSAALVLSMMFRAAWAAAAATLAFALAFVWFPTLLGTLGVIWKDVATTSLALLGLASWLVAVRRTSFAWFAASACAFCISLALRYNAAPLSIFILGLMGAAPFGLARRRHARARACAILALALGLAFASVKIRLPDLALLPPGTGFAGVQEFDLIGISACTGINELPPGVSHGVPVTVADIRTLYDPRHVQLAFRQEPGLPALFETDAGGEVERAWPRSVLAHKGCYLMHRWAVFRQQIGLAGPVFYPTHGGIDRNEHGLALAHPDLAARWIQYVTAAANGPLRRAYILYILAALGVAAAVLRRTPNRLLLIAMLLGALAYPATLFFVGPAADARYVFPSNVVCVLLLLMSLGDLVRTRAGPRAA